MNNGTRHKPYPRYKNSGVEWLGDIPEGWPVERMKFHVPIQAGYAFKSEDFQIDGVPVIRMANLKETRLELSDAMRIPRDKTLAEFALKEGDVLMGMSGSIGLTALVRASDLPCQLNQRVGRFRFRTNQLLREFLRYFVRSQVFKEPIVLNSTGTAQLNVSPDEIGNVCTPIPDMHEQRAIAEFLDRETARIDELIAKKERLIGLLEEKRAALITHAVTRGLNPDAPLRDSGIEWLGQIPAHWQGWRLKHLAKKIGSGKTPRGGAEAYAASGVAFLRSQNVQFGGLDLSDVAFIDEATDQEMASTRVTPGDTLLNITGASLGRCCIFARKVERANVSQHVCIIRPNTNKIKPEFLTAAMVSRVAQSQIFAGEVGVSREGLSFDEVGAIVLPLPPRDEQAAIVDRATALTHRLQRVSNAVLRAIEQLGEYRSALITSAVTGKIDLRNEMGAAA